MDNPYIDVKFLEFLLRKIYSVNFKLVSDTPIVVVEISLCFVSLEMANTAMYYFMHSLKKERVGLGLYISNENKLILDFTINEKDILLTLVTKNFTQFELGIIIASGKLTYSNDTILMMTFNFLKRKFDPEIEQLLIIDDDLNDKPLSAMTCYLYKFGNDGYVLHYEEPLSL